MKKILIIGAGFLQSFVIKRAHELGYYTIAIDGNPDSIGFKYADKHETINIIDENKCLKFAKTENIDGVLTAATDFGVLSASYIAGNMNLNGISYKTAKLIKNKYLVRKCFQENQIDDTKFTYEIDENTNLEQLQLEYPIMVKPCDGSGSRGASRVNNKNELINACKFAIENSISKKAEIEPFIDGEEYGVESLVTNNIIHVLGVMKKKMTKPPYYAELGHQISNELNKQTELKVIEYVKNAIKVLGINNGSVNMDLLITKTGDVHIIDVGARMGGNMIGPCIIPYGTGINYIDNMIKNAVGDELDFTVNRKTNVVSRLLAFDKNIIVDKLPNFKNIEEQYNVEIYHHLNIGDEIREYHTNLDGCGYIIVRRDKLGEAKEVADLVLKVISNEIFQK